MGKRYWEEIVMDDKLHCKKCGEALVIIPPDNEWDKCVFSALKIQELYCPKCGKAHAEVKKND